MKNSKLFIGLFIFLAVIMGMTSIHSDMNQKAEVENNQTLEVRNQYDELRASVYGEDNTPGVEGGCATNSSACGLYENVVALSQPQEDIFSSAAGALWFIPSIINFLVKPVEIFMAVIDSIGAAFPSIPGWAIMTPKILFVVALIFGIISMVLRWRA